MIVADGWTEAQIELFTELVERGLLTEEGKLTEAGRELLGQTGYFPMVTNVNGDPRFGAAA